MRLKRLGWRLEMPRSRVSRANDGLSCERFGMMAGNQEGGPKASLIVLFQL